MENIISFPIQIYHFESVSCHYDLSARCICQIVLFASFYSYRCLLKHLEICIVSSNTFQWSIHRIRYNLFYYCMLLCRNTLFVFYKDFFSFILSCFGNSLSFSSNRECLYGYTDFKESSFSRVYLLRFGTRALFVSSGVSGNQCAIRFHQHQESICESGIANIYNRLPSFHFCTRDISYQRPHFLVRIQRYFQEYQYRPNGYCTFRIVLRYSITYPNKS